MTLASTAATTDDKVTSGTSVLANAGSNSAGASGLTYSFTYYTAGDIP